MTSPSTLATLIELAEARKNKAAQELAQAAAAHARARERLVLIENYRADYEARMRGQTGIGIDGTLVGNYARFIQQLTDAVEQQTREVERCALHLDATRAVFFSEERKLKSLEVLARREAQRLESSEAKRAQKQIDEFANRRHFGVPTGYAL
ncbi:MAG: flagellar export protein FliJ [Pigmentiphaga sp.]|uniref:flagellar export protein FliJ n=1 Tax=Pigmentiphaga sp. TaxID=1977564 RepID=UPI0029B99A43|nr:flagellar export protein FliJ [Pigmentiphaga sp.]MDX3904143.1 flagellar export protein FliJ [Pigmentiphaga sp.]